MAEPKVRIRLEADPTNAVTGIRQTGTALTALTGAVRGLLPAFGALAAAQAVISFFKRVVTSASEAEQASTKLKAALAPLGEEAEKIKVALDRQSAALQILTRFSDDSISGVQARIAVFTSEQNQIEETTRAIVDLAAAHGIELEQATAAVVGGVVGAGRALKQYGVEVDSAASQSEKLTSINKQLNETYGGAAQRQVETFSGEMSRLGNVLDDIFESTGRAITENDTLKGVLSRLSNLLNVVAGALETTSQAHERAGEAAARNAGNVNKLTISLGEMRKATIDALDPIEFLAQSVGAISVAQLEGEIIKLGIAIDGVRVSGDESLPFVAANVEAAQARIVELTEQVNRLRQGLPAIAPAADAGFNPATASVGHYSDEVESATLQTLQLRDALSETGRQAVTTAGQYETLAAAVQAAAAAGAGASSVSGLSQGQIDSLRTSGVLSNSGAVGSRLTSGRVRLPGGGSRLISSAGVGGIFAQASRNDVSSDGRILFGRG